METHSIIMGIVISSFIFICYCLIAKDKPRLIEENTYIITHVDINDYWYKDSNQPKFKYTAKGKNNNKHLIAFYSNDKILPQDEIKFQALIQEYVN